MGKVVNDYDINFCDLNIEAYLHFHYFVHKRNFDVCNKYTVF